MRGLIGVELLRRLPPGPVDVRDVKLPGFVLRIRKTGRPAYYANYGRGRWQRLGTTAVLTRGHQMRDFLGNWAFRKPKYVALSSPG